MNKKISLGAAIAFMLIVATATFAMTMIYANNSFNRKVTDLKEREKMYEKFGEIDREVRAKFYGVLDETRLMDSVASGYITGLGDPYSSYINARTYDRMVRREQGNIVGIGIITRSNPDGYLDVVEVYPDSPASAMGIQEGDVIVKIDDEDITPENTQQMRESIQGEPGTRMSVVVRRDSEDILISDLTRRSVVVPTVSSLIMDDNVGYIRITEFDSNTSDQFNRELQRVINSGATSIVFDLRDNSGGLLRGAARSLDRLLPAGPIASTTDREGNTEVLYDSDANEIDLPMVVLVNENTASAAELFAQALRDYGKARIVGVTTLGKGVIQDTFKLSDGSALELTIAELLPPSGESFNNVGVKPDYEEKLDEAYDTDTQLQRAVEVAMALQVARETSNAQEEEPEASQPDQSEPEEPVSQPEEEEESSQADSEDEEGDNSEAENDQFQESETADGADEGSEASEEE